MHRQPGFTEQDQAQGRRAKRKSQDQQRRQARRQRAERRAFESFVTVETQQQNGAAS